MNTCKWSGDEEKTIVELLTNQRNGVLATCLENHPFCYRMAFVTEKDYKSLLLVTDTGSGKYKQIMANPTVCFFLDNTRDEDSDTFSAKTLCVFGEIKSEPDQRQESREMFINAHPELSNFLKRKSTVMLSLRPLTFKLVINFEQTFEVGPPM